jgi:single-strand DNA-binding protein
MSVAISFTGNVTGDPTLRFTQSGAAVCSFTVAVNERVKDRETDKWRDGDATFYECSVWRQYAENVAESVVKGTRVVVQGKLKARSYEAKDGTQRTVFDVQCDEIGVSLRYNTAQARKADRSPLVQTPVDDPWQVPEPVPPF